MLQAIFINIKSFYNVWVFSTFIFIAIFSLYVDYPYFKKLKNIKDAGITRVIGIVFAILPVLFFIISKL